LGEEEVAYHEQEGKAVVYPHVVAQREAREVGVESQEAQLEEGVGLADKRKREEETRLSLTIPGEHLWETQLLWITRIAVQCD
jgi:hypothetical protein